MKWKILFTEKIFDLFNFIAIIVSTSKSDDRVNIFSQLDFNFLNEIQIHFHLDATECDEKSNENKSET